MIQQQKNPLKTPFQEVKPKQEGSAAAEVSKQEHESSSSEEVPDPIAPPKGEKKFFQDYDITGNEEESVLRKLEDCFAEPLCGKWCGFYNQGFPAYPDHKHMFWHVKFRKTTGNHEHHWHTDSESQLTAEYIRRHFREDVTTSLQEVANYTCFECDDPRLYKAIREEMIAKTEKAKEKIETDFKFLQEIVAGYIDEHGKIPYCVVCHILARPFLGGGVLKKRDHEYPAKPSAALSVMFWNLGQWCRSNFKRLPLPTQFEKFRDSVDPDIDEEHVSIANVPQYNIYFVSVIKNLAAHVFLNCESMTLHPHRTLLENAGWTLCFNNTQDLLRAARLGKNGSINQIAGPFSVHTDLKSRYVSYAIYEIDFGVFQDETTSYDAFVTRARMNKIRVCIYHVINVHISKSPAVTGEMFATMCWECMVHQVDIIAGDANKGAYLPMPKKGGIPTYTGSVVQFWIDRMIHTATQSRNKNYMPGASPVRAKHFASSFSKTLHSWKKGLEV